jgi:predicted DNA-binding transcriptional regulator YafY
MTHPSSRLITLIMLLQSRPNQQAAELAAQLDVSVRTLHRYMEMLDELGIPVYTERGPHGGFSLVRGYKLPPLVFTPEEAVALHLGAGLVDEVWGPLYREAGNGALAKLHNVLPDEQRGEAAWARRTLIAGHMQRSELAALAPVLVSLRDALREQRSVELHYQGGDQDNSVRRVDPYALAFRGGLWYLVGYCHLRQALRIFRADRIRGVALLDQRYEIPADFDARRYLDREARAQVEVRGRLRFTPVAAGIARAGRAGWETLDELPDGSVEVSVAAPDLIWLASLALSFGPLVTVTGPDELRRMVCEQAAAILERYR